MIKYLVIVIIKLSIVLPLQKVCGLAGVRIRTLIEEREQPVYLFLTIAIGHCHAAGQILATGLAVTITIILNHIRFGSGSVQLNQKYHLVLDRRDYDMTASNLFDISKVTTTGSEVVKNESAGYLHSPVHYVDICGLPSLDRLTGCRQRRDERPIVNFFELVAHW